MDVCFTGPSLTLISAVCVAIATPVLGAIGMLFRYLMQSRDNEIKRLNDQNVELFSIIKPTIGLAHTTLDKVPAKR